MPQAIFISYRRNDSQGMAGRIYDFLLRHFPARQLFFDVDNIPPGENFETSVVNAVAQCNTMLVIIGPRWLQEINRHTASAPGKDWVELEITTAIRQNLRIIPLLLEDTRMPEPHELPASLQPLSLKNAFSVRHISFGTDMQKLAALLKESSSPKQTTTKPRLPKRTYAIAAIGLAILLAAGALFLFKKKSTREKVIAFLDKEFNNPEAKKMESWGGQSGSLRVSRSVKLLYHLPVSPSDSFTLKEEQYIDALVYKGLVSVKTLRDEVFSEISVKDLEISLTDKGKQYLIGETTKEYYLNAFDFGKVKILDLKENGDTVYVEFRINGITNKTPVYDLITDEYKQKIEKDLGQSTKGRLLKTKDGFKILYEDESQAKQANDAASGPNDNSGSQAGKPGIIMLKGEAINLTSNTNSGVELAVSEKEDGAYACAGSFDNITLYGRFETTGKKLEKSDDSTSYYSFQGLLRLGDNDGTSYPPGTKKSFSLELSVSSNRAAGTYQIDPIPDTTKGNNRQKGLLRLTKI